MHKLIMIVSIIFLIVIVPETKGVPCQWGYNSSYYWANNNEVVCNSDNIPINLDVYNPTPNPNEGNKIFIKDFNGNYSSVKCWYQSTRTDFQVNTEDNKLIDWTSTDPCPDNKHKDQKYLIILLVFIILLLPIIIVFCAWYGNRHNSPQPTPIIDTTPPDLRNIIVTSETTYPQKVVQIRSITSYPSIQDDLPSYNDVCGIDESNV